MGYKVIIYGRIEGATDPCKKLFGPFSGNLYHHNRCVVQGLPDTDSEWPFLSRHMFSMPLPKLEWNYDRGMYKTQIIHFGASLKVGPSDTGFVNQWLDKFEQQLLTPLVWLTAVVHFEHETAGKCVVNYDADWDSVQRILEDFRAMGSRVEEKTQWVRQPEAPHKAFIRPPNGAG